MTYEITDATTNRPIARIASFIGLSYKGESKVTRYPVERGGFFSANKVGSPWSIPLQIAISGTSESLRATLATLAKYEQGTELVNITTPFHTYLDGNIESLSWTLNEGDATGLLILELGIVEIRQIDARYTSVSVPPKKAAQVKNKSDASTVEAGKQQPKPRRQSVLGGWLK
jgi:hypothetical protein